MDLVSKLNDQKRRRSTLPETNSSPPKVNSWKDDPFLLGKPIFRDDLASFREGSLIWVFLFRAIRIHQKVATPPEKWPFFLGLRWNFPFHLLGEKSQVNNQSPSFQRDRHRCRRFGKPRHWPWTPDPPWPHRRWRRDPRPKARKLPEASLQWPGSGENISAG